MNIDTFFSFMETYFEERKFSYRYTKELFIELNKMDISFKEIIEGVEKTVLQLNDIEKKLEGKIKEWTKVKALKTILELTNQKYWTSRSLEYRSSKRDQLITKLRKDFI